MENNTIVRDEESTTSGKKEVQRSAAYPLFAIQKVIEFVTQQHKNYPNTVITRSDADAVNELGYTNRFLGAAVHFGLMVREGKDGYKVSALFISIYKSINEQEKVAALKKSFSTPKLYHDLIEAYDNHSLPIDLATIVFRKHNIAEAASQSAADAFIESGKFIGVVNESNILRLNSDGTSYAEIISETISDNPPAKNQPGETAMAYYLPQGQHKDGTAETEVVNFKNGRRATISFPSDISLKEIALISKRLEEITLRINEEGAV